MGDCYEFPRVLKLKQYGVLESKWKIRDWKFTLAKVLNIETESNLLQTYKRVKFYNNITARLHEREEEGQGWVLAVNQSFLLNVSFLS